MVSRCSYKVIYNNLQIKMSRYNNNIFSSKFILDTEIKRQYYISLINPEIPRQSDDIYVVSTVNDRLDLLAFKYYQNSTYWWIIAAANPELRSDSLNLNIGTQVRIPKNFQSVILLLQQQLKSR